MNTLKLSPVLIISLCISLGCNAEEKKRPNILFAISDDQSYPHASAYGDYGVETPSFDRLALSGVLFENAFVAAPQCSPNRASILTGRSIWQNREAGTHGSYFPSDLQAFTRLLEASGYHVGYTGKPWSPGNWSEAGWDKNPVGTAYDEHKLVPPAKAMSNNDYSKNFEAFMDERDADAPFFFWYGSREPHLDYEYGSGVKNGKRLEDAGIPPFFPDSEVTRTSFLDYAFEIEWFDRHLGKMLGYLESIGELDNTIVIVTSDNGMPFPYAKANLQEFGIHVPMVISGPKFFPGGRTTSALASHIDIAPTIIELARLEPMEDASGISLLSLLKQGKSKRDFILAGRERHTHARSDNLGYPARVIRTDDFLYIWNMAPDRWPMGIPRPEGLTEEQYSGDFSPDYKGIGLGYEDIDASPIKQYMHDNRDAYPDLFQLAFLKRPGEQLYHIKNDPWSMNDLARNPKYADIKAELRKTLEAQLRAQGDPRMGEHGYIFESYPRFGGMRWYPGFNTRREYNPDYQVQE